MLPPEKIRLIASAVAASLIRRAARTGEFLELYLIPEEREQVAEAMGVLAAEIDERGGGRESSPLSRGERK